MFLRWLLNNVGSVEIHFSEKNWNLNFTDRFLKCGNSCEK
ncbi:hypothetical protein LEP1GSC059_4219 [Leptospira noguchii serovar Panama str. CZ214]|uniref:Uncharacterized protein n=1 Tax=Leptospira noguchii serovar Panama str. CZ214 TaxID=1001595 RepID=T0GS67_9LEPT|nr:hypothetical protein LEP1GSC059_4219 [Leptospira noguchii serovar Panama str. CZ214]